MELFRPNIGRRNKKLLCLTPPNDTDMKHAEDLNYCPDHLTGYLNKSRHEISRDDLVKYITGNDIRLLNFRYAGADGRLKTLNFVINGRRHLDFVLSSGERVDGSSLFPYIEAGSSDLYVVPRYRTAFINPFSEIPAIDILCSYYNKDGEPLPVSPEYVLQKAHRHLKESTGMSFQTMGELEYYVISGKDELYMASDQRGYHESYPFTKWEAFRSEAMHAIARAGGNIKYGHSEVGNFCRDNMTYEQNEIEFLPVDVEDAADQLLIAKWILRGMAYRYGADLTFAPKITTGKAGSGLHVHTRLMKDGKNMMTDGSGISDIARRMIAGFLKLAPSLTAFGNTNPTSYFRLVPHQEAPTNICWGDRNRSVLVRVPLGWHGADKMITHANPGQEISSDFSDKQTVEFRCPDGSADVYLLLAGLTVAARHGLEMEHALDFAKQTYVDVNIFHDEHKEKVQCLDKLPASCWESAERLAEQANIYMKNDIFPRNIIDGIITGLKKFDDKSLRSKISGDDGEIMKLVNRYFHCG
jgi:glutamine synthetase